jgi:hypothetical protein
MQAFRLPPITAKADTKEKGGRWAALPEVDGPIQIMIPKGGNRFSEKS